VSLPAQLALSLVIAPTSSLSCFPASTGRRQVALLRASDSGDALITGLAYVVIGLSVVAMGWGLLTAAMNKPPGAAQLIFAAVLQSVTMVQSIIAGVKLAAGFQPAELATTIGYLIGIVILVPIAWFWANSERTRFSGVVLAVAALSVFGMTLRLLVLWTPLTGTA
jgi:hypothetical protein